MLFNSNGFYLFLLFVLVFHYFFRVSWKSKKTFLLLASYLFYAAWNPPFVLLLWISTLVDWAVARRIAAVPDENKRRRQAWLLLSLVANLGLLGYFKYGSFALENFMALVRLLGLEFQPAPFSIILPVGISFYTFQSLSYSLDVYFRRIKPANSFLDFALYVSFFPQLVAGPIVRSEEFLPQCREERRASSGQFGYGLFLLTLGLFQKSFFADVMLAPIAEELFASKVAFTFLNVWTGVLAFSAQIFFDFSGYTSCAVGTALCLGFQLPPNFKSPYAALGFSDFWRRWHISLSSWLRDYLYIPLGGNRKGPISAAVNIMITMLLGGLWHGASWNFVIWGGLHGSYLILERSLRARLGTLWNPEKNRARFLLALGTFVVVSLTWIFFRSPDLATSLDLFAGLVNFSREGRNLKPFQIVLVFLMIGFLLRHHWKTRNLDSGELFTEVARWKLTLAWIGMVMTLIIIRGGGGNAFIYFQF